MDTQCFHLAQLADSYICVSLSKQGSLLNLKIHPYNFLAFEMSHRVCIMKPLLQSSSKYRHKPLCVGCALIYVIVYSTYFQRPYKRGP